MLYDLVKLNRSYRGYDETRKLTKEEMLYFAECARLCPSSVNVQPLKYVIVYKEDDAKKLLKLTKWGRALPELTLPHPGMAPTAFIIICQDANISKAEYAYFKDVGIVAQTMLLAATEKELGGCMIGNFNPEEVTAEMNLPQNLLPRLIVAFGKPKETVVLTEVKEDGKTNYYRDGNDVHYVPKRSLDSVVVEIK